jgi:hypothetical protein
MGQCGKRAIHDAPEISIEKPPVIGFAHFFQAAVDRDTGIIDPGIDSVKAMDSFLSRGIYFFAVSNIRDNMDSLAARTPDFCCKTLERFCAARDKNLFAAALSSQSGRSKTNTT